MIMVIGPTIVINASDGIKPINCITKTIKAPKKSVIPILLITLNSAI